MYYGTVFGACRVCQSIATERSGLLVVSMNPINLYRTARSILPTIALRSTCTIALLLLYDVFEQLQHEPLPRKLRRAGPLRTAKAALQSIKGRPGCGTRNASPQNFHEQRDLPANGARGHLQLCSHAYAAVQQLSTGVSLLLCLGDSLGLVARTHSSAAPPSSSFRPKAACHTESKRRDVCAVGRTLSYYYPATLNTRSYTMQPHSNGAAHVKRAGCAARCIN